MRDNVEAWEEFHSTQNVQHAGPLFQGHLVLAPIPHESNQHALVLLHHAYDRDALASM